MKILDIALKDLLRSFRSLFLIGMGLVAPLTIAGLIYVAFSGMANNNRGVGTLPDIRVAVVNLDRPQENMPYLGETILTFLRDDRMPSWLVVSQLDNEAAARAAIENQQIDVAVVVPPDFSATMAKTDGHNALTLLHDPTLTIGPTIVKGLLEQFVDGVSGSAVAYHTLNSSLQSAGVTPDMAKVGALIQEYSDWYGALETDLNHGAQPVLDVQAPVGVSESSGITSNPMDRMVGAIMAGQLIFFAFFTGAYSTQSLIKEDEEGTLARLFTTPTGRSTVLGGKFLAVFATVVFQSLVLMFVSGLIFHVSWGNPASAAMALIGQVVAAGGLGIFLISLIKTTKQAGPVLGGALTALGMLGGLFTSNIAMPPAFATLNRFTPQGWVMNGWKLAINGAVPQEVLLTLIVLLAMGAFLFILGARNFGKRFA